MNTSANLTFFRRVAASSNDVLKEVIKKVRRQKQHILTFVHHDGAPHHNE
jgi:hypothetical protein